MLTKIVLENYMSHARTVIEPAAGLTVLIGPNNCGKSAIVSALETLARATRGDFMVRHGEKESRVTVETDDGHTIVWRRKGGTVSYIIDGREVHRDVPDDLHEHLKLPEVQSDRGGEAFDVHFAFQKSPIFLLNEPPSRAATFFSASSDAGRLLEIQDRHRDRVLQRKRDRKRLAGEVVDLEKELAQLSSLPDLKEQIEQLEAEHSALIEDQRAMAGLTHLIDGIETQNWRTEALSAQLQAVAALQSPPALEDTAPLESMVAKVGRELHAAARAAAAGDVLHDLHAPPVLADTQAAESLIARITTAAADFARHADDLAALAALREPPALDDPAPLERQIELLARAQAKALAPALAAQALAPLRDPPDLADPQPLERMITTVAGARRSVEQQRRDVATAAQSLADAEAEIRAWAEQNPNCPICGGKVIADTLLESGGHAHG